MKKDKAVRKAEFKAAVKRQLKSLIGPMIILAVIIAGVLTIAFWKNETEPVPVIKVNGYEGEEKDFVLENDYLRFVLDAETTQFAITVKKTGKVWYSNPQDADSDSLALASDKDKLKSTLLLTYSTVNGVDTVYSNYTYSMAKGIYQIEAAQDYIKVYYSVGDMDKEYVIPTVIKETDMEALLANMSKTEVLMVNDYYKKYDINKLGKKEDKAALLAGYPIMESEVIYVLRDTTKDNLKSKFETYFAEAGYTKEAYLADKELDLSETASDQPVFNVNMVYRLDGDDLLVEVPMDEIEYKADYPLLNLNILPFFGAAGTKEEGFLLIPEGGGSIINFNNGKLAQSSYYANLYGWDMAQDRTSLVHETRTYYNLFGMSQKNDSFYCVIEGGAPYASVAADISGRSNSYNYVNAVYNVLHREQYDVADKYNGEMFVYEEDTPDESLIQKYHFVNSGSYVDMAQDYSRYLTVKYGDSMEMNTDTSTPVSIEIVGAVDKVKQILGIPVSRPLKLTSYQEAKNILQELKADGMTNISLKLSGWANGGIQQKILKDIDLVSDLGSGKDFKALLAYAGESGIDLYLDGITNYSYESDVFDGFIVARDSGKFVSKERAKLIEFSKIDYSPMTWMDHYYLLKGSLIPQMVQNLADYAKNNKTGVSFRDIGMEVSSDFNEKEQVTRQEAMLSHAELLRRMKDSGTGVMINMGNDYAMPYSDAITNMDLKGTEYSIIDDTVPFYQMAIHGYINYTGEPLNLTGDYEEEILESAEYGAGLSFTLMSETAFILQNTYYSQYYGADYTSWHDKMFEIYNRYNTELGNVYNQKMINHEILYDNLTCTTYEDGTKVYVNYNREDYVTKDGIKVPSRDYVVIH